MCLSFIRLARTTALLAICLVASACALAQGLTGRIANHQSDEWHHWVAEKNWTQATRMCTALTRAPAEPSRLEAEKCLATVAMDQSETTSFANGHATRTWPPAAVDDALNHWNHAIQMAPQDFSLHTSRMHTLFVAGRYKEMTGALEDSCAKYHGADAVGTWLQVDNDIYNAHQVRAALSFAEVLDRNYPNQLPVQLLLNKFRSEVKRGRK
jgi:hypothetical protein